MRALGGYAGNFTFREPRAAALDRGRAVIDGLVAVPVMEVKMLMRPWMLMTPDTSTRSPCFGWFALIFAAAAPYAGCLQFFRGWRPWRAD